MAAFSTDCQLNFGGGADYTVLEGDNPALLPLDKAGGVNSGRLAVHEEDF